MSARASRNAAFFVVTAALFAPVSRAEAEPAAVRLAKRLTPISGAPSPLADERGRIPILVDLPKGTSAASLGLSEVAPGIAAARLPLDRLLALGAAHPELPMSVGSMLHAALDVSAKWNGVAELREGLASGGVGAGVVVGVVDTGIDVGHPAFIDEEGKTRIAWLITWGDPRGFHPELEAEYGCTDPDQAPCAVYSSVEIQRMLDGDLALGDDVHDFFGHGTHVASIAGGNGRTGKDTAPRFVGMAPGATLVIAAPTVGGGFSDDGVLRGTRFIFDRASDMGLPAVANLSIGGDFGPHDGTSALEKGLAAMVGDDLPGRVITVASGNSAGLYKSNDIEPLGIHTEVHVDPHAPAKASILVPGEGMGDVFVWITFREGDDVSVGLDGPTETWIRPVSPGDDAGYDDGDATAGVINDVHDGKTSIPAGTNSAYLAWSGSWDNAGYFSVVLEGSGDAQLWVTAQGAAVGGAYFLQALRQGTVNTPASHPKLMAVGCTVNRHAWKPQRGFVVELGAFGPDDPVEDDSLCYFSAGGPTPLGVPKPEIVAPGAFVAAAMSYDADPLRAPNGIFSGEGCPGKTNCYVVDTHYAITTGTSMSSPEVAGAVALLLEQDPSLTQARATAVLQASARRLGGKATPESQVGPGALDLRNALQVLEEEPELGSPPDLSTSWWSLSAETARPDRSWPIWGTIELRRADGTVASGLDGTLLGVEIDGGALITSVTKVRHGLFRFAVAGLPGQGGSTMRVRVTYDGVPIGDEKLLPIAIDAYAAGSVSTANGGCDCGASAGSGSTGGGAALGVALGLCLSRRRRAAGRRAQRPA
jgi:subtilisin family serine protease